MIRVSSYPRGDEMLYTKLGQTDISVSKICLGCMSFGVRGLMHDWTLDETESEKIIRHALDSGINFFDTANGYSAGTSEEFLGRILKRNVQRDKVIIASKVYFNPGRLSREAILREIDGSLKRLGTDYLDPYIIHRFDYNTPIEKTMQTLHELVQAGKVRALGASAMYGYQFHNMQIAARDHGWTPFSASRRRARTYSYLQTNGNHAHAVQPVSRRSSGTFYLGRFNASRSNRSCCAWQI